MKAQTTDVMDLFYCSKCHNESSVERMPCCDTSRKKSFYAWQKARRDVDVTLRINRKIDELLNENDELRKRIDSK